jgi:16S rRNA G966 N2-methylase RsmD
MTNQYEAEIIIGLEDIAITELKTLETLDPASIHVIRSGFIRFIYDGKASNLHKLKSIVAIYAVYAFDIPRPKAILGHQNFTQLTQHLTHQLKQWQHPTASFGIGAAGADSSVFQRIKHELSQTLQLPLADDGKGELFIRFMPAHKQSGWEVLIRTTQQPLATRHWRIHNVPGALNATVAFAMTQLANLTPHAHTLNLCSGTATLLIEQASTPLQTIAFALDNDPSMLSSAQINIEASQTQHTIQQIRADAQQTPFANQQFDVIYADLPFGHHIGSHDENEWLYPAILTEAERVTKSGGRMVLITHEINLFKQTVQLTNWTIQSTLPINLSGLHPHIFVLERN